VEETLSKEQQAYKFKKYGMKSLQDHYWWHDRSGLLFTVTESDTGYWYIQTVTKGKGNWSC
jgi:hypothetical protein